MLLCIQSPAQTTTAITRSQSATNLARYITEKNWTELFPNRGAKKDLYSYRNFLAAAVYFPEFLSNENAEINKRELCAFLANMAYETGGGWEEAPGGYYKWGLHFTEERGCEKGCPQYTDVNKPAYPPVPGRSYHGRGGLQLSWNYNYGQFSETMFGTKEKLLQEPELVVTEPILAFASALWFWITPQYPKPSCHNIINASWKPTTIDSAANRLPGFGTVVNVINGGIECGNTPPLGTAYRYGYYQFFCKYFKVSPGENMICSNQRPFGVK